MNNRRRAMKIKSLYSIPYNITYDLNGGTLSSVNPSTYTLETSEFNLNSPVRNGYTFLGWTMNDSEEYVFKSIFGGCGDREYIAHWNMNVNVNEDISNNISDLTIDASDDANNDGVVDNYKVSFKASSSYERINFPITNLIIGQKYKLSFVESNNATHGTMSGYYPAMYGSIVSGSKNSSISGSLKETARSQGGLIAEWIGQESGHLSVIDGKSLNGPRNVEVVFTATAATMYWIWDFGLISDGIIYTFNFTDIIIIPVIPEIKFNSMALKDDTTYVATFNIKSYDQYNLTFTFEFDGESGTELLYYPITGLTNGTTYTITFNHKFSGAFINGNNGTYDYGCGILADISTASLAAKMSGVSSNWLSNTWTMNVVSNSTETVTLTFTATGSTAYWVWNMANVSDGTIATINLDVEKFNAKHKNGGSINYL